MLHLNQQSLIDALTKQDCDETIRLISECDVNFSVTLLNPRPRVVTPLHLAAEMKASQAVNVVLALLSAGAKVDAQDDEGCTPLHGAALTGNLKTAELLVAHSADVHARNRAGYTAKSYCMLNRPMSQMLSGQMFPTLFSLSAKALQHKPKELDMVSPIVQEQAQSSIKKQFLDGLVASNCKLQQDQTVEDARAYFARLTLI